LEDFKGEKEKMKKNGGWIYWLTIGSVAGSFKHVNELRYIITDEEYLE
jgi:hypothetical protein